ncbi:MAG: hypothetical protein GXP24_04465 [Planctomycetes bacterium]|nr:hypothetical protein [Planctomycetota bacterium]
MNKIEEWKAAKHPFDVWPEVLRHAEAKTPLKQIEATDLERLKWYGFLYRKRDGQGAFAERIRITACELSAQAAREIAYIAYEYGHGIIDITTRGNIQVQGLALEHIPNVVKRLSQVEVDSKQTAHDNVRNVICHPLSGLDPTELIDTRQLCHEVVSLFHDSREYADLPRKFNIALSGQSQHGIHYWTQDISYLACHGDDGEVMFQVLLGGKQGQNPCLGKHLPVLVAPEQIVLVTRALLDLFRTKGSREKRTAARFAYLLDEIGVHGVLDYLDQNLDFPLQPSVMQPPGPTGYDDLVGWFRQQEPGRWTMGVCVPVGRMSWSQLEGLSILSKKWGDGTLRTTHEQGMMIPNIRTGFKDAAATSLAALGLSLYADSLSRNTLACTGKQFCTIAVTDAKGPMLQLLETLRQRALTLHGIRIHMSGCPASCALHHTADIGLKGVRVRRVLGTREGFDVFLGGGVAGQIHLGLSYRLGVDADQLPQVIEEVIQQYYLKHKPGQSFSAYWREELRHEQAGKVDDEDYLPATWVCDLCDYHFQAEDPPVFCPGCAGLRRNFARLEEEEENTKSESWNAEAVKQGEPQALATGAAPLGEPQA